MKLLLTSNTKYDIPFVSDTAWLKIIILYKIQWKISYNLDETGTDCMLVMYENIFSRWKTRLRNVFLLLLMIRMAKGMYSFTYTLIRAFSDV